ncbi:MFS transporter [Paraburkholderia hospita]|uniref:MFS transporter n=1 Tax=Paraburkholderia hospita TaxID=169430 RepID=UPI00126027B5|nr:MFS transporter [Paraburkholderia hospita]
MSAIVAGLIVCELLPISLLTPIANDLRVTKGAAGQAVSATALSAMTASIASAPICRRFDRRLVLRAFGIFLVLSCMLASVATKYELFLVARIALGFGLGGFWSMAASVAMRLVPTVLVPKALAFMYGGTSLAMLIAGPLGSYMGVFIGWRGVFSVALLACVASLIWMWRAVPAIPPSSPARLSATFTLLLRPQVRNGILATVLFFCGHFAFFTYSRPYLELVSHFDAAGVSLCLLGFGLANMAGTFLSASMLRRNMKLTLGGVPLIMTLLTIAMAIIGNNPIVSATSMVGWGLLFGVVPVAWTTWLTWVVSDQIESAGGLQIACTQLAITTGSGVGGVLFDVGGIRAVLLGSGIVLLVSSLIVLLGATSSKTSTSFVQQP